MKYSKIVFALFIFIIPSIVFAYDLSAFKTINDLANKIYENLDNNPDIVKYPVLKDLQDSKIFCEENIYSLSYQDVWHEAHALAAIQSLYLDDMEQYSAEFTFVTDIQMRTRSHVLRWALTDETMINEGAIPSLLHQIGDELTGLSYLYPQLKGFLSNEEKQTLAKIIVSVSSEFQQYFPQAVIMGFQYCLSGAAQQEEDPVIKELFQDFVKGLSE